MPDSGLSLSCKVPLTSASGPARLPPSASLVHRLKHTGKPSVKVLPGGHYVGYGECAIVTTLGSCVAVCMRDPYAGVAGMNHFMLPDARPGHGGDEQLSARYGVNAMELLINALLQRGGQLSRMEVKLFGGGHVLHAMSNDIGQQNIDFIHQFMHTEGLTVQAQDVGGDCSRRLIYDVTSGKVRVKQMNRGGSDLVAQRDLSYIRHFGHEPVYGSIELFDE